MFGFFKRKQKIEDMQIKWTLEQKKQATNFAMELLMPKEQILKYVDKNKPIKREELFSLAEFFRVEPMVMYSRLHDLKIFVELT